MMRTLLGYQELRCALSAVTVAALALSAGVAPARAQGAAAAPPQTGPAPQGQVLRLSMDAAVDMAMQANLGLQADRLNLDAADRRITQARAAFLPVADLSLSRTNSQSQPVANPDGTQLVSSSIRFTGGTQVRHLLPWYGTAYSVSWGGTRRSTSGRATFNPQLDSFVSLNFSQPLWQGFRIDGQRAGLETSQRNRVIADLQLEQRIVLLDTQVRFAYLALISAIEQNKVANENMRVAEESLRQARARVEVGVAPEIEIIENEAQVETQRVSVISTEAAIQDAKDALRRLILDPNRPDYWTVDLEPSDAPTLSEPQVDVEAAVAAALANRLDLQQQRRNIEILDLNARAVDDSTKPSVDLNLSLQASAFGGTQFLSPEETTRISFGSVLGDTFGFAFPTWTVGFSVGVPIGQTSAKAQLAQQRIAQRQEALALREAELSVIEQVRGAAREVENSYRRVRAVQASLAATQRQLDAEQRRFEVGLSTTFQLQQRQRDLFNARAQEVSATIAHQQALIRFARVQKIN